MDKRVLEGQRTVVVALSASDVCVWGRGCATSWRTSVYFDYPNIKKVSSTGRTRELDAPLVCRSGTTAVARGGKVTCRSHVATVGEITLEEGMMEADGRQFKIHETFQSQRVIPVIAGYCKEVDRLLTTPRLGDVT